MPISQRHRQPLADEHRGAFAVSAHLIGVAGVLLALVLGILVLAEAGWLERLESEVREVRLPSLPSLGAGWSEPSASLGDLLDSVAASGRGTSELTTRSFERHQGVGGGVSSSPAGNRSRER